MRIYGSGIAENELADTVGIGYVEFTLKEMTKSIRRLKTSDSPCQDVLALVDMFLVIAQKFPSDTTSRLKQSTVKQWQAVFDAWFDRVHPKIPAKYRARIKADADRLFAQLCACAHELDWLD